MIGTSDWNSATGFMASVIATTAASFTLCAQGDVESNTLTEVGLPGECIPLQHLPPNHPAIQFMCGRRQYSLELLTYFGCSFCQRRPARWYAAEGRVIVPIYMHDVMVGWQGALAGLSRLASRRPTP